MTYLFNNCQNLEHRQCYGGEAIFDLYVQGPEDAIARALNPGDVCWVVRYRARTAAGRKQVVLHKCTVTGLRRHASPDSPGGEIWVIDGQVLDEQVLPKAQAARHSPCAPLFNKLGHFKQVSAVRI